MKPNYYHIFRTKLYEQEVRTEIESESTLEKILRKSKKVTDVLTRLLTSQKSFNEKAKDEIREIVTDIRFMSYKPTTFRIVVKNGNYFDLKYDPTPLNIKYPEDFDVKDSFVIAILGKKYNLANQSELEQALDYINILLSSKPVVKTGEETPEGGAPETPAEPTPGAEGGEETPPPPPEGEEETPEEPK